MVPRHTSTHACIQTHKEYKGYNGYEEYKGSKQQPQPQPEEHSRQRRPDVAAEASIVAPSGATRVDNDGHVAVPSDLIRVRELLPKPGESQEEDGAAGSDLAQLQQELFARYETAAVFLSL